MQTTFLVGLMLLVPLSVCAQDDDHTPAATVLSMPVTQWETYYAHHHGGQETELTEREALAIYEQALRPRNLAALKRLPAAHADRLRQYQSLIKILHSDVLILSSDNNGGGTIYEEIGEDAAVRDEQLIWVRCNSPAPPLTLAEGAMVQVNLNSLRQAIRQIRPTQFIKSGQFSLDVATLRHDESQLRTLIASDTTHDALAVSRYVVKEIVPEMSPAYP